MLIRRAVLDRIVAGEIDLQFRRWTRPTVKAGGTLRTSVGMLEIEAVDRVRMRDVRATDAHRAGYPTRAALLDDLRSRPSGDVYRIAVRFRGADPLAALRARDDLSDTDLDDIASRLDRLDRASPEPWTRRYLGLIAANPHVRAGDLAASIGVDTPPFKANVRKLKAIGLTISHSPGYELSPRGIAYVAATRRDPDR